MHHVVRIAGLFSLGFLYPVAAQTPIYKCTDADGGVSYSQLPCPSPKPAEPEQSDPVEDVESEEETSEPPESPVFAPVEETPEAAGTQAECKKRIRDQIDAIDAEIGRGYSPDKAEDYKQQLLALTRELRKC